MAAKYNLVHVTVRKLGRRIVHDPMYDAASGCIKTEQASWSGQVIVIVAS